MGQVRISICMGPLQEFRIIVSNLVSQGQLRVSCIVGAGLSAGSGLSTFRGKEGLYKNIDPMELASRQGFQHNPELVWSWYRDRIAKVFETEPNAGHYALVRLEELGLLEVIVTQNVDGLHVRAGQSRSRLVEIHGTLSRTHCFNECGRSYELTETPKVIPVRCECGSFQRPSVVWFGESIDVDIYRLLDRIRQNSQLLIIIGTSGTVIPVARLPYMLNDDMKIVTINPDGIPFSDISDISFQDRAEVILPELVAILNEITST